MKDWKNVALKITLSLVAEVMLTLVGLDDLANYSEFVFERPVTTSVAQRQTV